MESSPVFFLTDFGTADAYTAQMKASVMSFTGYQTPLIDLTNQVPRGDILQGAYHLGTSMPYLPMGSVVLAVVDPGVGGSRGGLAAVWNGRYVIAPDNGLVSLLPPGTSFRKLPPPDQGVSRTFHGRDWFAPCAARLSVDPGWIEFLAPLKTPVMLNSLEPCFTDILVSVTVLHTDAFGNCILSLDSDRGSGLNVLKLLTDTDEIPLKRADYYSQPDSPGLLFVPGSQGYMEIAVNGGSAAELTGLKSGMRVKLTTVGK